MKQMYVVIWNCQNPRAIAVFDDKDKADAFAAEFKTRLDALLKQIGLTGNERVYLSEAPLNPATDINDSQLIIGMTSIA